MPSLFIRLFPSPPAPALLGLLALLVMLAAPPLHAQQARTVEVRAAFFPHFTPDEDLHLLLADGKSLRLEVWSGRLSPEQRLPLLSTWRVGTWKTDPESGKRRFQERGSVKPKSAGRQFLLLVPKTRDPDSPLELVTIPADAAQLKEGGIVVLNMTPQDIGAVINKQRVSIGSGKSQAVDPGTQPRQEYPVSFHFRHQDRWLPFVETVWFHGANRRSLAIITQPKGNPVPRMSKLDDVSVPAPARD